MARNAKTPTPRDILANPADHADTPARFRDAWTAMMQARGMRFDPDHMGGLRHKIEHTPPARPATAPAIGFVVTRGVAGFLAGRMTGTLKGRVA